MKQFQFEMQPVHAQNLCINHEQADEITRFIIVSFFHVSTPFKNALVDVPASHYN
jgi:hypothetical protein